MLETSNIDNIYSTANFFDEDDYGLQPAQHNSESVGYFPGTLRADTFRVNPNYEINVFSGNGNINYGSGAYDTINLSNYTSAQIADYSSAKDGEGTLVNTGTGDRAFDSLTLTDGTEILFEGIERVVFSDRTFDQTTTPNDPLFDQQWNLHMMGLQTAWNFSTGSDDVLIGVQDTGLGIVGIENSIHPDIPADETWVLSTNIRDDLFRTNFDGDFALQSTSHGTAVQGIISADTNNNVGIAGINWNSDVYNIDVIDGSPGDLDLATATRAMIAEATSNGQKLVINMSLEGSRLDPELEALIAANQDDVLFVIATGNGGADGVGDGLSSPAIYAQRYDNVIAVGASWGFTSEITGRPVAPGTIATYSNRGQGLTLVAPTSVVTTQAVNTGQLNYDDDFNGTSAATPNAAGVASLVWSANDDLTAPQVKAIMSETAFDLGTPGYDLVYGHGFVNADAAVRRAVALRPSEVA